MKKSEDQDQQDNQYKDTKSKIEPKIVWDLPILDIVVVVITLVSLFLTFFLTHHVTKHTSDQTLRALPRYEFHGPVYLVSACQPCQPCQAISDPSMEETRFFDIPENSCPLLESFEVETR
jgi:hypothetical protein